MPWNASYETSVGRLRRDRDQTLAQLAADESGVRREYGFDDPTNPFSRARKLQEGFDTAKRGTMTNYAAGGQLYSGSLSNARTIDRSNYETSHNQLRTEYDTMLRDLASRRLQAKRDYQEGVLEAQAGRVEDALEEPVDPDEYGGGGGGGRPGRKPPRRPGRRPPRRPGRRPGRKPPRRKPPRRKPPRRKPPRRKPPRRKPPRQRRPPNRKPPRRRPPPRKPPPRRGGGGGRGGGRGRGRR